MPGEQSESRRVAEGMVVGAVTVVVAVLLVAVVALVRRVRDGRFRSRAARADGPGESRAGVLDGTPWTDDLGTRATLLQFSSSFCSPCRATRRTLGEVAQIVPGVTHVEVDAEQHLELVRRLGILRTPTTLVLDPSGREVSRAQGAPTKQAVIASLDPLA